MASPNNTRASEATTATVKVLRAGDGSLSDQIYETIYGKITTGDWPVGTRLPTEIQLAKSFGVSRPVVREALLRLRIDGIVESRQRAGTHVISAPHKSVLEFTEPGSIADLQRCFEFRVGVEGEAAYLAATLSSSARIAEIQKAQDALKTTMNDPEQLGAEEDIAFHLAVARATENNYYIATIESATQAIMVAMRVARTLSSKSNEYRIGQAAVEHDDILAAIRAGDGDRARSLMRQHIESARTRVFLGRVDQPDPQSARSDLNEAKEA